MNLIVVAKDLCQIWYCAAVTILHSMRLGGIQQLRGQNFAMFWPPHPLRGQFLYPKRGQKQTFFDPLSPHLVHVVIEWPIIDTIHYYFPGYFRI